MSTGIVYIQVYDSVLVRDNISVFINLNRSN